MIRRTVLVLAAAVALLLTPTAAFAHNDPHHGSHHDPQLTCRLSDSTLAPGQLVKIQCSGGRSHERVALTVDGSTSHTTQLNSRGEGSFTIRLRAEGTHTITISSARGAVVFNQTVTVDQGYRAHGYECTVSDPTPAIGEHFGVHCSGGRPHERVTQTIASSHGAVSSEVQVGGAKSLTSAFSAAGEGSFTNTLAAAGDYTVTMTSATGAVGSTQVVRVEAASFKTSLASVGQPAPKGLDGLGLAMGGGALVLMGAGAALIARRRRSSKVPA
jgi:hypothetical protein